MMKEAEMLAIPRDTIRFVADVMKDNWPADADGQQWFEAQYRVLFDALTRPSPEAGLVEALQICQRMIEGEQIAHAVVDASTMQTLQSVVESALLSRSGAGEPVAWRVRRNKTWPWEIEKRDPHEAYAGFEIEALYATPAPQAGHDPATIEAAVKTARDQAKQWVNGEAATVAGKAYQSACVDVADSIRALAALADWQQDKAETSVLPRT